MLAFQQLAFMASLLALVKGQTPPGFTPSCSMNLAVIYAEGMSVQPGSFFQATEAFAVLPEIGSQQLDIYKRYAVFMIDLDVVEDGKATTILHWYQADLLTNPCSGELLNLSGNGALYVGPTPPPGPSHRYVLLLFTQPAGYVIPECFRHVLPLTLPSRQGFNVNQFMEVAELGQPTAANYFSAANPNQATSTRVATATSLHSADCRTASARAENQHWDLR
ncbi:hypothetical protein ACLMJK_007557 [Lecanora helva]